MLGSRSEHDLRTEFVRRSVALGAPVHMVASEALLTLIREQIPAGARVGVSDEAIGAYPDLAVLRTATEGWPEVAISAGLFGVAFSGNVAVAPAGHRDRLLGILSRHQIIVLSEEALLPGLADTAAVLRGWFRSGEHRYVTYVGGPSRTSDIERVLTRGVHGPERVTVMLVRSEELVLGD